MTRKEILLKKYDELIAKYTQGKMTLYKNPSTVWIEPFKIADNLYYVGDKDVCIHLIDTGEGLILIDSGFIGSIHLLVDSIWRLGFDPKNVKWIIHTHGHYDHFGSSDEFKSLYGTKLAISKTDAEWLREKPYRAMINEELFPLAKIPEFDYEIEDGEIFSLGNTKIRCIQTPGHTPGVVSLFSDVSYEGETYLAGLFGGAGLGAVSLPYMAYNEDGDDTPQKMLSSIEKLSKEPVMVHLGNHAYNSHTVQKREKQIVEGGNPFIGADSWKTFLSELKEKVTEIIAKNEELDKQLPKE